MWCSKCAYISRLHFSFAFIIMVILILCILLWYRTIISLIGDLWTHFHGTFMQYVLITVWCGRAVQWVTSGRDVAVGISKCASLWFHWYSSKPTIRVIAACFTVDLITSVVGVRLHIYLCITLLRCRMWWWWWCCIAVIVIINLMMRVTWCSTFDVTRFVIHVIS